tara:strand:- start:159 stop:383 length:225 start_codon:yes stop_codon:yes gene_type:complete
MSSASINLNDLSPTGLIGFWVLLIGIIFTGTMFYFVFFRLNGDNDSHKDIKRKKLEKIEQNRRIARLYPKKNQI